MTERDFQFFMPLRFWKAESAPTGEARRIAGVISTEKRDYDGEVVLQNGLDFSYFLNKGWFNDNHGQKSWDMVGYPTGVQRFQKGQPLPDGTVASSNCTWAEGYLIPGYEPAEKIWNMGISLAKAAAPRSLGFSVEGKIRKRTGMDHKTIAKAEVRNVAITHCPKNDETRLNSLVKSLVEASLEPADDGVTYAKALSVAGRTDNSPPDEGGEVLVPQSLQRKKSAKERKEDVTHVRSLSKGQAVDLILTRYPNVGLQTAGRIVQLAQGLKARGLL